MSYSVISTDTGDVLAEGFDTYVQAFTRVREDFGTARVAIWPLGIDPPNCACTECLTGEYVPLASASTQIVQDMLAGYVRNNTGVTPIVRRVVEFAYTGLSFDLEA